MFCLKCGNPLTEEEQFCSQCGTAVQPESQQPDESNALVDSTISGGKSESENISASEESGEPETNDTSESNPRLRQEPIPAPAFNSAPSVEPVPAPPPYQAPPQPQYQQPQPYQQQAANQPQYWQAPNQPNPIPVPVAAPMILQIPPFMKRKAYFMSNAPEKIKSKVDTLSYLTGMGVGAIVVFLFLLLIAFLGEISGVFDQGGEDENQLIIIYIVGLSVLMVFALLCVLGMKTKHFAFYIFLLLPSMVMTAISIIGFIMFSDENDISFNISEQNGLVTVILLIFIAVAAIMLIFSVVSLILSIIVSRSYKKAQQEYMWRATNGNIR